MDSNGKPDYDAMFRSSQQSKYPNPRHTALSQEAPPPHGQRAPSANETVQPEVLDATGHPLRRSGGVSAGAAGLFAVIIGIVTFILLFVGMFLHIFMWLNLLLCLTGVGFGVAALLKKSPGRITGAFGVALCLFDLAAELICMLVTAISAGVSAIFHLVA